eukprot:Gb_40601 [translate_table: standard]
MSFSLLDIIFGWLIYSPATFLAKSVIRLSSKLLSLTPSIYELLGSYGSFSVHNILFRLTPKPCKHNTSTKKCDREPQFEGQEDEDEDAERKFGVQGNGEQEYGQLLLEGILTTRLLLEGTLVG